MRDGQVRKKVEESEAEHLDNILRNKVFLLHEARTYHNLLMQNLRELMTKYGLDPSQPNVYDHKTHECIGYPVTPTAEPKQSRKKKYQGK